MSNYREIHEYLDSRHPVSGAGFAKGVQVKAVVSDLTAFVTGSRAYGSPREDSDIDLVVLADQAAIDTLKQYGGSPCRFGNLNLILVPDAATLGRWRDTTDDLASRPAPVTRDEAILAFNAAGLTGIDYANKPDLGGTC